MSLYNSGIRPLCSLTQKIFLSNFTPSVYFLSKSSYLNWLCIGCPPLACGKKTDVTNISTLFKPVQIPVNVEETNIGAELTGKLDRAEILKILNKFTQKREIKQLCIENGMDAYLQQQAFASFRRYCIESENLPVDLHVIISDVLQGAGHIDDIFPFFLRHCRTIFPHLDCMDDLKKISDLRQPANWYPNARAISRKIIFHAGPTNSGKTYNAMESFLTAKSGVYCGPLKLLATEVFNKANERGTPCDLVTGEERRYGLSETTPASHVACTVEMTSVNNTYDVAIIDEIQMLKDPQRGWAWTRAFLGLIAKEIHVCGELGALELLKNVCETTGETVELKTYDRLTELSVEDSALISLDNVMAGDCIVCFSKNDIYQVSRQIEARGKEVAVIYGGLPPGTKLAQAAKFNDPNNSCKVMVATDAIGMGLNLSIRRIIFYSLIKPSTNEKGEKEIDTISVSQALQIAGRAGRYGTQWDKGYVTTFKGEDLQTLRKLLQQTPDSLTQAGLHPTADQIELYGYHLPSSTLSNLMDIFVSLSTVDDSLYFMCNIEDFKFLADMIQHVPLSLRARYVFCCAPINRKMPFVCSMFLKITRQYSKNDIINYDFIAKHCGVPLPHPKTILDLVHLEAVFDVMDLYLWLSYRFIDAFPDANSIRIAQKELDETIQKGVFQITKLLKNSESNINSGDGDSPGFSYSFGRKPSNRVKIKNSYSQKQNIKYRKTSGKQKKIHFKRNLNKNNFDKSKKYISGKYKKFLYCNSDFNKSNCNVNKKNFINNNKYYRNSKSKSALNNKSGRLTERLLAQGLLTPSMLDELRKEWDEQNSDNDSDDDSSKKSRRRRKK